MEEVEEGMEVAMGVMAEEEEGMGTAKRREKLTQSLKLMLLLSQTPTMATVEAMADMVEAMEVTDTAVNVDQLNLAMVMAAMVDTDTEDTVMDTVVPDTTDKNREVAPTIQQIASSQEKRRVLRCDVNLEL